MMCAPTVSTRAMIRRLSSTLRRDCMALSGGVGGLGARGALRRPDPGRGRGRGGGPVGRAGPAVRGAARKVVDELGASGEEYGLVPAVAGDALVEALHVV